MEDLCADVLGLAEAGYGVHQRVVVCVTDAPDRGADALKSEMFGELHARLLPGINRSLQHRPMPVERLSWPGTRGELTQIITTSLMDAVLAQTWRVQPACVRAVVYFVLAKLSQFMDERLRQAPALHG
ncbi:hypothetical protein [Streptomyces sp. NBC_01077]|uniref:hypothetical protein n=1 Tax=Streptomyces sp. NBC_01077 TaxID=2903746 RepID=UPI00386918AD